MNCHCPLCHVDLGRRKLGYAIVARMEVECSFCKNPIRLNVHPLENQVVLGSFGAFLGLAALAYLFKHQALALAAFAVAMLGAVALPVLERTVLRDWPRYARIAKRDDPGRDPD